TVPANPFLLLSFPPAQLPPTLPVDLAVLPSLDKFLVLVDLPNHRPLRHSPYPSNRRNSHNSRVQPRVSLSLLSPSRQLPSPLLHPPLHHRRNLPLAKLTVPHSQRSHLNRLLPRVRRS